MSPALRRLAASDVAPRHGSAVEPEALEAARAIIDRVRSGGEAALRSECARLGDLEDAEASTLYLGPDRLQQALASLSTDDRGRLQRIGSRIERFAEAQRDSLRELVVAIPGGEAGHSIAPIERVGCYAPGGRYPLPSSVLMTAVTARAAGVTDVWIASPRPQPLTLAAAAIAGARGVLAAGGAQAVAALAIGVGPLEPRDLIVGPGNRWVTAAKQLLVGEVAIDLLAGPSEVAIVADAKSDPERVAIDLLAQAEHDSDARVWLVTADVNAADAIEAALEEQLLELSTRAVARAALERSAAVVCRNRAEMIEVSDRLAPEHLQLFIRDADEFARRLRHYGSVFVGESAPTALGDYGAGPNHVLPTGGTARSTGGLSVLHFLRARTWLRIDDPEEASTLYEDAAWLARREGLEAHAKSVERRLL